MGEATARCREAEALRCALRDRDHRVAGAGGDSRGVRAPGSGKFRISWAWKPEVHLSECGFKAVTINIDYSIDVAQLGGALAEDSTARVWWAAEVERGFTRRVEVLTFMRDGAKNMHRRLNTMTSNTCANLTERANAIARMAAEDIYAQVESARPLPVEP